MSAMRLMPVSVAASLFAVGLLVGCGSFSGNGRLSTTTGAVTLTASKGSCSFDRADAPPWVVGQPKRLAVKRVRHAGFRVKVVPQTKRKVPAGVVVDQVPPREFATCKGAPVWLFVSAK
jgi:beta-lactam-binding protein with PASTA domain